MEKRRLGGVELTVGPLGFGGNVFGWTVPKKAVYAVLGHARTAGGDGS